MFAPRPIVVALSPLFNTPSYLIRPSVTYFTSLVHITLLSFIVLYLVCPLLTAEGRNHLLALLLMHSFLRNHQSHLEHPQHIIMAASWSFNLIDFPPLPNQKTSEAKSRSLVAITAPPQPQLPGALSHPRRISIGYPTATYGQLHFLSLPGEVRLAVWRAIHYDILLGSEELWFDHPSTAWDGLQLSCRQIHIEIADFWPSAILPQAKLDTAFTQVLSIEILANFRRLSLELPFNKSQNFYESLALALGTLAPVLEDLRLFFIGKDEFKVKSFVHGCGLRDSSKETSNTRLVIDGQYQPERKDIFIALYFMQRLRTLVLSNANYPFLQSLIIKHKPRLEYLHISTDPRSCLHTKLDLGNHHQLIVPPKDNYPPLKKLHIGTNAALSALQVAAKVARTVEE